MVTAGGATVLVCALLSLFLTYASDFIYSWVFEGEVTLIYTPGVILDELGTLSLVCR